MRFLLALCSAFCALFTPSSAQWFEGWVTLPDSLVGVRQPECLIYDSTSNTVWVGGRFSDRVIAIACDSNKVVASIRTSGFESPFLCDNPVDGTVFGCSYDIDTVWIADCRSCSLAAKLYVCAPGMLFHNRVSNKVYCASATGVVVVIDGGTNRLLACINVGGEGVGYFGLDSRENWLYCSFLGQGRVRVIDCSSDSLIANFVTQRVGPGSLCYSPVSDVVYCAHYIDNVVLAMHRDTILAEIPVGQYPVALCYNSRWNKVYSANWSSGTVSVIDCATNRVLGAIYTGGNPEILLYDSLYNRLYCTVGSEIVVIDAESDIIVDVIPNVHTRDALVLSQRSQALYYPAVRYGPGVMSVGALSGDSIALIQTMGTERPVTVCWDSATNKVYTACDLSAGSVYAIDGARNAVLTRIAVGSHPVALCPAPGRSTVYCADSGSATLSIIDCHRDSVAAQVVVGSGPHQVLYVHQFSKVYSANAGSNDVTVVDADDLSTRTVRVGARPWALAYSAASNKVYCANYDSGSVSVLSAANDSVVRTVAVGPAPTTLCWVAGHNVIYCARSNAVVAVDCGTDSIVAVVGVRSAQGLGYDFHRDWLYCSRTRLDRPGNFLGIAIIDCRTNTVIADFDLPGWPVGGGTLEFGFNDLNNKMYGRASGGGVYVYYGTSQVGGFGTQGFGGGLAWNSYNNRMYAACPDDSRIAVFRDVGGAGVEDAPVTVAGARSSGLMVRGVLWIRASPADATYSLLSSDGRRVLRLSPGCNDVRHLPAGVYFVHETSRDGRKVLDVTKVVILR